MPTLGLARYRRGLGRRKPGPWARINTNHPLGRGLVGCWLFNEGGGQGNGSIVRDLTTQHNGTFQISSADATTGWFPGFGGPAFRLNATNSEYWACNGLGTFDSSNWTLWVRIANLANQGPQRFICWGDGGPTIWFNPGTPGTLAVVHSGTVDLSGNWSPTFSQFVPYSLLITRAGSAASVWVDGIPIASSSSFAVTYAPSGNIEIGRGGATFSNMAKCDLVQAAVWSRGLSSAEIRRLYSDPFALVRRAEPRRSFFNQSSAAPPAGKVPWHLFFNPALGQGAA